MGSVNLHIYTHNHISDVHAPLHRPSPGCSPKIRPYKLIAQIEAGRGARRAASVFHMFVHVCVYIYIYI